MFNIVGRFWFKGNDLSRCEELVVCWFGISIIWVGFKSDVLLLDATTSSYIILHRRSILNNARNYFYLVFYS